MKSLLNGLYYLRGALMFGAMTVSTVMHTLVLFVLALFKLILPSGKVRDGFSRVLSFIAESWTGVNNNLLRFNLRQRWDIELPAVLARNDNYLVCCNHQSWADILVLHKAFNRRIPFMRFFLKQQLIWFPFLGLAWWALDFPFVRRYTKSQIAANPQLRGRDQESARRACEKFKTLPVSIMNFAEGTRLTPVKYERQNSPYANLLKPRAGALGEVLQSLGETLTGVLDVTIIYPAGTPSFWDLLGGRQTKIMVRARVLPVPEHLLGHDFRNDRQSRRELSSWINAIWADKDQLLSDWPVG